MAVLVLRFLVIFTGLTPVQSLVNVAVHKHATQSSTLKFLVAGNAVNGVNREDFDSDNCASTDNGHVFAWWRVDLGGMYRIKNIALTYRMEYTFSLMGYYLYISNTTDDPQSGHLCYHDNETFPLKKVPDYIQHINCSYVGRYVTLYNRGEYGQEMILELCEMEVYGCALNKFGQNCDQTCSCLNSGCDPENGICDISGCVSGWKGDNCATRENEALPNHRALEIAIGTGGTAIIIAAVVVFILIRRKRKMTGGSHSFIKLQEKGTYCNISADHDDDADDSSGYTNLVFPDDEFGDTLRQCDETNRDLINVLSIKIQKNLPDREHEVLQALKAQHHDSVTNLIELEENFETAISAVNEDIADPSSQEGRWSITHLTVPSLGGNFLIMPVAQSEAVVDFWNTVLNRNSDIIVCFGNNETVSWPTIVDMTIQLAPLRISCNEIRTKNTVQVLVIQIEHSVRGEMRTVLILKADEHITSKDIHHQMAIFRQLIETTLQEKRTRWRHSSHPIILLHRKDLELACLFSTLCMVVEKLKSSGSVDIFAAVRYIQRKLPMCCDNVEQYRFCYNFMCKFLETKN